MDAPHAYVRAWTLWCYHSLGEYMREHERVPLQLRNQFWQWRKAPYRVFVQTVQSLCADRTESLCRPYTVFVQTVHSLCADRTQSLCRPYTVFVQTVQSLHWKLTLAEKSFAAPGTRWKTRRKADVGSSLAPSFSPSWTLRTQNFITQRLRLLGSCLFLQSVLANMPIG